MKTAALCLTAAAVLAGAWPATAQHSRRQATEEAPVTAKRSLFSGNESRIAELG
jgi:hypothetical protein